MSKTLEQITQEVLGQLHWTILCQMIEIEKLREQLNIIKTPDSSKVSPFGKTNENSQSPTKV